MYIFKYKETIIRPCNTQKIKAPEGATDIRYANLCGVIHQLTSKL